MKIEIDTDELAEFFEEEWHEDIISTTDELKEFLLAFCKKKIEDNMFKDFRILTEVL